MEDNFEQNQKEEKKAFITGLITIFVLILIIALSIYLFGFRNKDYQKMEVKNQQKEGQGETNLSTPVPTPAQEEGQVAGEKQTQAENVTGKTYTVQNGDTLYEIGRKFKVDWRKIAEANGIENAAALKVGKQIIIPSQ